MVFTAVLANCQQTSNKLPTKLPGSFLETSNKLPPLSLETSLKFPINCHSRIARNYKQPRISSLSWSSPVAHSPVFRTSPLAALLVHNRRTFYSLCMVQPPHTQQLMVGALSVPAPHFEELELRLDDRDRRELPELESCGNAQNPTLCTQRSLFPFSARKGKTLVGVA